MLLKKLLFPFLLIWFCCSQQAAFTQCVTPINIFPYTEGFESGNGNWVRSSASHWEWGTIVSKPVITSAGGGTKCWVVGGFSGSLYNSGSSFLQSPCFDISTLSNPEISFKIFWETERKYDGASLEFTTDGGLIWQPLGSINSNANCLGENWFNYDPVNFLGGPGWSGNIQSTSGSCQGTGGSGAWLTAKHTLSSVVGASSIIFRFVFAAGTTCNAFDGFAIDDVRIGESPAGGADYTYTCSGNNNVAFSSSSAICRTSVSWDFGDVASGVNNSSSVIDPAHLFSSPGNYTVTLTTNFTSGPSIVIAKNITVITATAVIDSIKCNAGQAGSITINVNPPGAYNYTWDTNPVQVTPFISNLGAGTYTIVITGTNTCSTSLPVVITEPAVLNLTTHISDAKCGNDNGSITTTVFGGTVPYNYLWSNMAVTASITALSPGTYSLLLTDANGCTSNANNLRVENDVNNLGVFLGNDTNICPGQSLTLSPGVFTSYKWQDNTVASTYTVTQTGIYSVMVTDAFGCTGSSNIKVTVDCPEIYFPTAFTPDGDTNNDSFGPLGSLSAIKNYKLVVYGRWGEIIFLSTDPFKKWDGTYKGKELIAQAFVWTATYSLGNFLPEFKNGTILLIH